MKIIFLFLLLFKAQSCKIVYTCALNACPNSSQSCLAYCSDFPVSVAYKTVAFILRESARPNNLDVNFTALLNNNNNFCHY